MRISLLISRIGSAATRRVGNRKHHPVLAASSSSATVVRAFAVSKIVDTSAGSIYVEGKFRSNAQKKINAVPVIEVQGTTAICDGGGGVLGHPIEYIQVNTRTGEPATCKYCGLRYKQAEGHHHDH